MNLLNARNWLLSAAIVLVCIGGELSAQQIPLQGVFAGVGNDFGGVAFPIGRFGGLFDPNTGTADWTTWFGVLSNQTISFELTEEVAPGIFLYEQSVIFLGGTGIFTNVSGSADFVGLIDPVSGEYIGLIDGILAWE